VANHPRHAPRLLALDRRGVERQARLAARVVEQKGGPADARDEVPEARRATLGRRRAGGGRAGDRGDEALRAPRQRAQT
jgi:hypothetical protein